MSAHHDPHRRPLIDLIPEYQPECQDLDVSDEEDTFYAFDEGVHPKLRSIFTRTKQRLPRRLQRHFGLFILLAIVWFAGWSTYLAPKYSVYKQEAKDMDMQPEASWGKNARPEFKGMVQVKELDKRHLPKGEGRLIVVGDVHGCRRELEELLRKMKFHEGRDHLVLTGDIVAKGPDSPGVVALAISMGASCVRGNHEDKLLLSIAETATYRDPALPEPDTSSDLPDEAPLSHHDHAVRKLAKSLTASQITWLQSRPVILDVGKIGDLGHVVVVHAGLIPDIPLSQQDPFQVMNMRTIDLKTRVPSGNRDGTPWEKFWNHEQKKKPAHERSTVIYGHDKKRGKNIQNWSMGLDSGCVSGGHLTAMVIEHDGKHKFMQVKCKGYIE